MKTLREFVQDELDLSQWNDFWDTTSAYPITRSSMPQLDADDFKATLDFAGIPYDVHNVDGTKLRPTQSDYDPEKVKAILSNLQDAAANGKGDVGPPIITSNDGFVLDGHHRYIASTLADVPIKTIQVDLPINQLYHFVTN